MTSRFAVAALGLALSVAACKKPSEDSCRKAIANMRSLLGTDTIARNTDTEGDVRRCRGGSTKEAVACAEKAATLDELRACKFMQIPDKAPAGSGSAAPAAPAGSDSGSAAPAPAPAPAPAGSDSAAPAGSGSAAPAGSGSSS
jgi:hypothetical protein